MTQDAAEAVLKRLQEYVIKGRKHFVQRNRQGTSWLQMLLDVGLLSVNEAWDCILQLKKEHYFRGPSADHLDLQGGPVIWEFKMDVNGDITYIKLKDEPEGRGCVCLGFHRDEPIT